jgi:hypothetical protein
VNQSLSNTFTPKNIKFGLFVKGVWPVNTDVFTDEDFSLSSVTERSLQSNETLEKFGLSDSHISNSNLDVSSQLSTTGLNTGHSSSQSNCYHGSPVGIKLSLEQKRLQRTKVSTVLTDAPVKALSGTEVETRTKPFKVTDSKRSHENLND